MATKIGLNTGNWSTAGSWYSATNTPAIHATTNVNSALSAIYSATFTAPNTVNACYGALIYIHTLASTLPTLTLTLQESTVDVASGTFDTSTMTAAGGWVWIPLSTPYVFTTTSAGAYRFKIVSSSATNTVLAAETTLFHYIAVDNRTGTPATSDKVIVCGNITTPTIITINGSQTIGGGGTVLNTPRTLQDAVKVVAGGVIKWNDSADSTLSCNGCFQVYSNGKIQAGTRLSRFNSSYYGKLTFTPTASGDYGCAFYDGHIKEIHGKEQPNPVSYVSGSGTAADPLITTTNCGIVGDEISITPSTDQATISGKTQYRFIIAKNSDTSYIVSNTRGGAENALTTSYLSTDSEVINIERNFIINTNDSTKGLYCSANVNSIDGNDDISYCRIEFISSATNKTMWYLSNIYYNKADHVVFYGGVGASSSVWLYTTTKPNKFDYIISCKNTGLGFTLNAALNHTLNNFYAIDCGNSGFSINGANNIYNNCKSIATAYNSFGYAGFLLTNAIESIFNNCEAHLNNNSFYFAGSSDFGEWNNFLAGTKGKCTNASASNFRVTTGFSVFILFNNSTFINYGTSAFFYNALTDYGTSMLRFHNLQDTEGKHEVHTNTGIMYNTGNGLPDTNVRTASTNNLKLDPIDNMVGLSWEFLTLCRPNRAAQSLVWLQKNADLVGDNVIIDFYLPNSLIPDYSITAIDDTDWHVYILYSEHANTIPLFAKTVITAKSVTSGASLYIADIYGGTNPITNLTTWHNALPSEIMFEELGDSMAIMNIPYASLTTEGTVGKMLVDIYNVSTKIKTWINNVIALLIGK